MKLQEFKDALEGLDPEMEVVVRLSEPEDDNLTKDDIIGGYAAVTDERSIQVEYGRVVILGDLIDE